MSKGNTYSSEIKVAIGFVSFLAIFVVFLFIMIPIWSDSSTRDWEYRSHLNNIASRQWVYADLKTVESMVEDFAAKAADKNKDEVIEYGSSTIRLHLFKDYGHGYVSTTVNDTEIEFNNVEYIFKTRAEFDQWIEFYKKFSKQYVDNKDLILKKE